MTTTSKKSSKESELTTLEDLYIEELQDLYSAENQILKALPKMMEAASDSKLKKGFELHLAQTKTQAERLEQIFKRIGKSPEGKTCKAMQGLVAEGKEALEEGQPGPVLDAALIASAQRIEHYEMAGYGTVRTFAKQLGDTESIPLLEQTLAGRKRHRRKIDPGGRIPGQPEGGFCLTNGMLEGWRLQWQPSAFFIFRHFAR